MDKLAYTYQKQSNQLTHVDDEVSPSAYPNDIDNQKPDNYIYNDIGQLIFNEQDNLGYTYYTNGLMKAIYNGKIGEAGTTKRVAFQYNESGHRIKKLSYNAEGILLKTTFYVRDAAGTTLAIYTKDEGNTDKSIILAENGVYGSSRLGTLNRTTETMLYEIKDHLGNVRAVVGKDQDGNMASIVKGRADYYPFGMQFPDKRDLDYRYAYQGQEKDEETGMEAFELRLWDSRIGRWLTPDPEGQHASPYLGMSNQPNMNVDPDGGWDTEYRDGTGKLLGEINDGSDAVVTLNDIVDKGTGNITTAAQQFEYLQTMAGGDVLPSWNQTVRDNYFAVRKMYTGLNAPLKSSFSDGMEAGARGFGEVVEKLGDPTNDAGAFVFGLSLVVPGDELLFARQSSRIFKETTVLGHYPEYVKLAESIGGRTFQIPSNIWNKMSAAEQWVANTKFLDRMILRGDKIRLATPLNKVKRGSYFEKELNYLYSKGYKPSSNGLWLIK